MTNDKDIKLDVEQEDSSPDSASSKAFRARNRTVMLSPDVTGEVRARLAGEMTKKDEMQTLPEPSKEAGSGVFLNANNHSSPYDSPVSDNSMLKDPMMDLPTDNLGAQNGYEAIAESANVAVGGTGTHYIKESKLIGFLISYDENPNGKIYELRKGRIIITSEPTSSGSSLLIDHESVSPMHAIMKVSDKGQIQILDQLSENGTKVTKADSNEVRELSGDKAVIKHGDKVSFGEREFVMCLIPGL